jgi:hypothetical protein
MQGQRDLSSSGMFTVLVGSLFLMFQDNITVSSSTVKRSRKMLEQVDAQIYRNV